MSIQCPKCGFHSEADANFCEQCGFHLSGQAATGSRAAAPTAAVLCPHCGGAEFDDDGHCLDCGKRLPQVGTRALAPFEVSLDAQAAAVSDVGRRYSVNQDHAGIARLPSERSIFAVSDGVSTAQHAEDASEVAVATALSVLENSDLSQDDAFSRLTKATLAAHAAIVGLPFVTGTELDEPMATLVVAELTGNTLSAAWAGDSRVYLCDDQGAQLLTRDDSWVMDAIAAGMPEKDAYASDHAHAITQCLGMRDTMPVVHTLSTQVQPGTWVLACTDGFWNYCDKPQDVYKLMTQVPGESAFAKAQRLVAYANGRGGRDNITVICFQVPAAPSTTKG